jgi:hypothetical protein
MANRIEMAGVFLSLARRSLSLSISRVEASELAIANGAASMPASKTMRRDLDESAQTSMSQRNRSPRAIQAISAMH